MGEDDAMEEAFNTAFCQLGNVEMALESHRRLVGRLRAAGCSTHYAEALLSRFELIRTRHVHVLAELTRRSSS